MGGIPPSKPYSSAGQISAPSPWRQWETGIGDLCLHSQGLEGGERAWILAREEPWGRLLRGPQIRSIVSPLSSNLGASQSVHLGAAFPTMKQEPGGEVGGLLVAHDGRLSSQVMLGRPECCKTHRNTEQWECRDPHFRGEPLARGFLSALTPGPGELGQHIMWVLIWPPEGPCPSTGLGVSQFSGPWYSAHKH